MTLEEKIEVADLLDAMGVDIIEAGFPIASNGDFEAVAEIAGRVKSATVAGLARAISADIARAGEAVRGAKRPRIHTFVSTSPIHLAHQMRKTEDQVLEIVIATVAQARNLAPDVEWSAMDATRTPVDYLCRCIEAAIKAGATTINLPDTVGYATPDEYRTLFHGRARARARTTDKAVFSGPIATTTWAWRSPEFARGLRAARGRSNAPSTASASGPATRPSRRSSWRSAPRGRAARTRPGSRHRCACAPRRLVAAATSFPVQYNKAIVGRNAFAHEERHPPGRDAKERPDLRDHDRRRGRACPRRPSSWASIPGRAAFRSS
jgi:2-isopropylmalate synthase